MTAVTLSLAIVALAIAIAALLVWALVSFGDRLDNEDDGGPL